MSSEQHVFFFRRGNADGDATQKERLGGKGANLAEMCRLGLPVPPGFTIATTVCRSFNERGRRTPEPVLAEVETALEQLEEATGRRFGDPEAPLLLSVRSGAAVSMPGMMDTVLNLGLNAATVEGLARQANDRRFALDARRRLLQMFGDVVLGVRHDRFERELARLKRERGARLDNDLDADALDTLVSRYLEIVEQDAARPFPEDPREQLQLAIEAVFNSWEGNRARRYREIHEIDGLWGTAVNVQAMVFGNLGPTSGTGVCFTRDPSTGENVFYGEYLVNAQGEDVVAGIRTPEPIDRLHGDLPACHAQLLEIKEILEQHYTDMQDLEFTVEDGELFMLQTRTGKRTAQAAVRIAVEMAEEGLIDEDEALRRVEPEQLDRLLHPTFDPDAERDPVARGLPASPGAVTGQIVFGADDAEAWAAQGKKVILVRNETSPEDIGGMHAAEGILTARGGMTSHAAVVARGMGKCCVAGCSALTIHETESAFEVSGRRFGEGDWISMDGATGEVMAGRVATVQPELGPHFDRLMAMADRHRTLGVRANADNPEDATLARRFGAEGIGLCRTEHMFFEEDRLLAVREMILASRREERERALAKLLPAQRQDFCGIFKAMDGLPVTVRLLDPPLHEFLPHDAAAQQGAAEALGTTVEAIARRCRELEEFNPMLGHRGCRLGISHPEIYDMQARAIAEAACDAAEAGTDPNVEIMVPLVGTAAELEFCAERLRKIVEEVTQSRGTGVQFLLGTMIEVPRAALCAPSIAEHAEFFSFGTNDLTQMTFGFSRDDIAGFLPEYVERGILPRDPFQSLDVSGVGRLVRMACEEGRGVRPGLKLGICGEHGGDPASIRFCHGVGLNYVSCSPYRVPIARLAAARAALD